MREEETIEKETVRDETVDKLHKEDKIKHKCCRYFLYFYVIKIYIIQFKGTVA
jgi:hypothetical protein